MNTPARPSPSPEEIQRKHALRAKTTTLFGRKVVAEFDDGTSGEMYLRQIRVSDYDEAMKFVEDDIGFLAYCLGKPREFLTDEGHAITPESFEQLHTLALELNAAFFARCSRLIRGKMQMFELVTQGHSSPSPISSGTSSPPRA